MRCSTPVQLFNKPLPPQGPLRYILLGKINNNNVHTVVTGYLLTAIDKNLDDLIFKPFTSGPVDCY